jgi:hypothetical protein
MEAKDSGMNFERIQKAQEYARQSGNEDLIYLANAFDICHGSFASILNAHGIESGKYSILVDYINSIDCIHSYDAFVECVEEECCQLPDRELENIMSDLGIDNEPSISKKY